MRNTIQMIPISEEVTIFILDFKDNIVTFRSSRIPEQRKKAKIDRIENDMVYFDNYHCHVNYLQKFLTENINEEC